MQFRPAALLHAAIGAAVVGAAALLAQPPTPTLPTLPTLPTPPAPPPKPELPTLPKHPLLPNPAETATPGMPAPDDRGQPKLEPGMDPQKMMADWMTLSKPGSPHALLKTIEGTYTTVSRVWMDPAAPPAESNGTATFKTVLGGRFLQQDYQGTMMNMPMSGIGMMGYDNFRHQYTSTWCDSMSTSILTMTGGMSQDGKTITMFGTMDEPTTKQVGKTVKWVTRLVSADKLVFESWEVECDTPMKVFEIEYTRAK